LLLTHYGQCSIFTANRPDWALGKALDDHGFAKCNAAYSALFDYFVGDDTYGLPPENRLFIWAGNALPLTDAAADRWWAINRSQLEAEVNKMQETCWPIGKTLGFRRESATVAVCYQRRKKYSLTLTLRDTRECKVTVVASVAPREKSDGLHSQTSGRDVRRQCARASFLP